VIDIPQTLRYSVVSGFCLLLSTIGIPLLSWWGLHYTLATFVAFCLIAVIGFSLHSLWTFHTEFRLASFVRYVATIAINLPVFVILIGLAHDLAGLPVSISTAFASAVLFIWNYIAARWAVLRRTSGAQT
jgi:putative flippase GtrA